MAYSQLISQSETEWIALEPTQKRATARDRVSFIGFLKTNQAHSQTQAGQLIGLAPRQSQRLWQTYRQKGLTGLGERRHGGQYRGNLSSTPLGQLTTHLQGDGVSQLRQA